VEPFFLGYLLIPLGYTSALAALSASAERALVRGYPEKAVRLLSWARKAPFLATYRSMCDVNLITAAYALEDFELVEEVWRGLEPKLESLRPYAGSALASYGATLIGRGRYREAEELLRSPLQDPKPNQRVDSVTVLCRAFCRANLASTLLNQGRLNESRELLLTLEDEGDQSPLLGSLVTFLKAYLLYLDGELDASRTLATQIDFAHLPLLYRTELRYHYATLLARCEDPQAADTVVGGVEWDTSSHRKLTRLRTLARAEISAAKGDVKTALSYFRDLKALRYKGALAFVRASAMAKREGHEQLSVDFLQAALDLDPESHWAAVAGKKLETHRS
jgi:tetratricopeptide (TPR) repeat protein